MDHIMPLALDGPNIDSNMQLLTRRCNLRKGAKHPDVWMRELNTKSTHHKEATP